MEYPIQILEKGDVVSTTDEYNKLDRSKKYNTIHEAVVTGIQKMCYSLKDIEPSSNMKSSTKKVESFDLKEIEGFNLIEKPLCKGEYIVVDVEGQKMGNVIGLKWLKKETPANN